METHLATTTTHRTRGRVPAIVLVTLLALTLAACGDDDGGTAASDTAPTTERSGNPHSTTSPDHDSGDDSADPAAFCEAHEAVEAASMGGDEAALGSAFEAFVASAPEELSGVVASLVDLVSTGRDDTPEFQVAYDELLAEMHEPCGRAWMEVTATDYAYDGVPARVAAGPTTLRLDNQGTEFHHMVVFRVDDSVTAPLEELIHVTHEPGGPLTPLGAAEAMPGMQASTFLPLEPGRYIGVCFIPTGATADKLAAIEAGEVEGGPAHLEHGMAVEFMVE